MTVALPAKDALALLLTAESLLLAAVALAATMAGPTARVPRFVFRPRVLAMGGVLALAVAAIGAGFSWAELYAGHFPHDLANRAIAGSLLVTIVLEPFIAFFLALGLWTED